MDEITPFLIQQTKEDVQALIQTELETKKRLE